MSTPDRPLSPHLQIYRWQLTMGLSILHRMTGFGLAIGAVVLTWWLLAAISGETDFMKFHEVARHPLGKFAIFGWVWAFTFHFLNGIRHLVWDTGRWLDLKSAYASGWFVFFSSLVLSAVIWFRAG